MLKRINRIAMLVAIAASISLESHAQVSPVWMRGVNISPDGKEIAFSYKGDIYVVDAKGGTARQLTTNSAYDGTPFWSPNGKHIAFASARYGGMDVMVVDAEGGTANRLTTHSAQESPIGWADDNTILFSRVGTPTQADLVYPSNTFKHIYKVDIKGGRQRLYSELSMGDISVSPDGRVLYNDVKGYEDLWRKHHQSPITRDVWLWDGATSYTRQTTFAGEDRNPVWNADGRSYYYLSEEDGTMNVYSRTLGSTSSHQLTHFTMNPVRYLSASRTGVICFIQDGRIYTMTEGTQPIAVSVRIIDDKQMAEAERYTSTSGASHACVSPKGGEVAFILNNDVYVTNLEYNTTKQITNTPERERIVSFSADGRSLVYDSERGGVWSIYKTTIVNKEEKNFTYSTSLKEELLTDGVATSFQPSFSPDGKSIAYLQNRTELRVMDADGRHNHSVMADSLMYSYSDGDQSFAWSPDSKWLLATYIGNGGWNITDVALVPADGKGKIVNLTNSGYSDYNARWALGGKAIIFGSDRAGMRSHGSWGAEGDVFITFLDAEAYEEFRMNKEELALLRESKKEKKDEKKDEKDSTKQDKTKELHFELDNLDARTLRLTPSSGNIGDAVLSPDGSKLYYIANFPGASGLWVNDLREHRNELKLRGLNGGTLNLAPDGTTAYMTNGGITKVDLNACTTKGVPFEAFCTNHPSAMYDYYFEHIWHQTKEKLYDPTMNGANWDSLHAVYKQYLPYINNGYDFAELASEMLGELNVSHTGCRYGGVACRLNTAELGVIYDETYEGDGLKIAEVIEGSPLSLKKEVTPGSIVTHIDGVEIKAADDFYPLLGGKENHSTRLTIKSAHGKTHDYTIRPISLATQNELLYRRWVARNERMVDSLSAGRIGYVHIKAMNTASFHELYKNTLSEKNRVRDALIVDTRHNGGGWLHNDVCSLLGAKLTTRYTPRGKYIGNDPYNAWVKPSCMLICEDNYSNAHGTPWLYKELGIGELIGTPVAGTMTAVWWETIGGFTFGIPQVGAMDNRGMYLENQTLNPDIQVYNKPEDTLNGIDKQLQTAVSRLMKK